MTNDNAEGEGDRRRVILAAVILALQIIILLWLLLSARDRFALAGQEPQATAAPTVVITDDEPTAVAEADADAGDAKATADAAATADAVAAATEAATADASDAATADAATAATADAAPTEMAMSAADAGVLAPEDVRVDPSGLGGLVAPDWLAQLVDGAPADTTANTPGVPPHLLLTFPDAQEPGLELAAPDTIDLNKPQVRIVPIAALLAWLQARGDSAGQGALEDLQSLLADPPPADEASAPATPLLSNLSPMGAARLVFEDFAGGHGVGYIAHMSGDEATPVTDEAGLTYVYQGLTDDGQHYVFMSWPVAADVPATSDAAAAESALAADPVAYYDTVASEVAEAADTAITPAPSRLRQLIASLIVGRAAVAAAQTTPEATAVPEGTAVAGAPADAGGIVWNWTASRGGDGDETAVANPPDYALVFWPDNSFSFVADCNVGRGSYSVADDGTVSLLPGAMTRAACPAGSQADEFLQTLTATQGLAFDESGDMILTLADGREAVFANAGPADSQAAAESEAQPDAADAGFTGLNLQWPGFSDAAGNAVTVDNPEDYTLALLPDGTFTFRADCNIGSGTYTYADDGTLTLLPGAMTRVACPEGSQSDVFLGFLNDVNGVTVADDGTVTMTTAEGSSAVFVSTGPVTTEETATAPEGEATAPEGEATAPADLLNIGWQWLSLSDAVGNVTDVPDPALYYVALLEDGTYAFVADCNRGAGGYTLDGTALTFAPGPMTLVACAADSLSDQFVDALNRVQSYALDGDNLLLTLDDGSVATLGNGGPFAAMDVGSGPVDSTGQPSAAPLAGVTWRWAAFRDAKQDYAVPTTADYTLVFNDDGTVQVVADCNTARGTYTLNSDGTLTLAVLATTRVACPAGSLSASFIEYLNQAGPYEVDEAGALIIGLMADGGTMTFVAEPSP